MINRRKVMYPVEYYTWRKPTYKNGRCIGLPHPIVGCKDYIVDAIFLTVENECYGLYSRNV